MADEKITKMTPEQEALIPKYVEKWIAVGKDTSRLDPEHTKKVIDDYRELIDRPVDVPLIIVDNPLEAWAACHLLTKYDVEFDQLDAELDGLFNGNPKKYSIPPARLPWQSGSFFVSTFAFYDFMFEVLGVKIPDELMDKYRRWEATAQLGCIYPMPEYTIVSQKPTDLHIGERFVLHRDGGPALSYAGRGDIKIFSLNGVRVPEFLAVTPSGMIDLDEYNKISNADVKAEFLRKVGIERFKDRGKLLDSWRNPKYAGAEYKKWHDSQYELWDMVAMYDSLKTAPYLSMVNQTTGIFHFEGVSPKCQSLDLAIKERLGGRDMIIREIA
ncbi:MAG: hypothetical protein VKK42_01155 [Lyngbya sp.]|nr:hypothetical protein [Lyngbya sp.]